MAQETVMLCSLVVGHVTNDVDVLSRDPWAFPGACAFARAHGISIRVGRGEHQTRRTGGLCDVSSAPRAVESAYFLKFWRGPGASKSRAHPRFSFLQHQVFFSSDQPATQLGRPAWQSKTSASVVVWQPTFLFWQHQSFFSVDQPATQLKKPASQSKATVVVVTGQPFCSCSQHQSFFECDQPAMKLLSPASQSNISWVVVTGQPRVVCMQHQAFFSSDQPASQFANPALQSKRTVLVVVAEMVVAVFVVVAVMVDVDVWVVAVVTVVVAASRAQVMPGRHPRSLLEQHHSFFCSDQPNSQLEYPAAQSKGSEVEEHPFCL
mmetsp:Transcript_19421/g.58526  ORF Transcript_19421/g.58526 Transcript_19421/m.58526 type:complete len:321 (-) Transcript_19421:1045-2007(-)